jgi:hypothetical protein
VPVRILRAMDFLSIKVTVCRTTKEFRFYRF